MELIKAETPNEMRICFGEKMRNISNVTEYGNDGVNMIVRTYNSEIVINFSKVNWCELKQL